MKNLIGRLAGALLALMFAAPLAQAQSKITVAVGGGACLCYLPTVLAKQLGEFDKAGVEVELINFKGGSQALQAVIGVGLGATAVAAMEQGQIDAAVMLDPSVTVLQGSHKDLRILSDTRTQKDTLETFGGEYPGGALYSTVAWINGHEKETQALTNAILATLSWIHSHSAEDIMAKMPEEMVGKDKAQYLAALKNTIPMYSETGKMDPKGADAVLAVFSEGSPEVAKANVDVAKTFTNKYVEQAKKTTGMNAK